MAVVKVKFYQFAKTPNSTKRVTDDMESVELLCKFKEATSIVEPTLIINSSAIYKYNYCYIEEFGRYYFVSNPVSFPNFIWEVKCAVDVMATFKDDILNTKAFIQYAAIGYNPLLADSRLPFETWSAKEYKDVALDGFSEAGVYILSVISAVNPNSRSGFATSYAVPTSLMGNLVSVINSEDFYTQMKEQFSDPLSAIISCIWIPISYEKASSNQASEIIIGRYATGIHTFLAKSSEEDVKSISITYRFTENSLQNYRNCEPYTKMYLYLPGVGITQIPMLRVFPYSPLDVFYCVDYLTGDITYRISGGVDNPFLTAKGNLAVEMPLGRTNYDPTGVLKSATGAIASTVGLIVSGVTANVPGALISASSIVNSAGNMLTASQTSTSVGGLLGGRSSAPYNTKIQVIFETNDTSDDPANIASTIGRPVMRVERIGNFKGFVKCVCAFIESTATESEQNKMSQIVNSGAYTPWGGIIIE